MGDTSYELCTKFICDVLKAALTFNIFLCSSYEHYEIIMMSLQVCFIINKPYLSYGTTGFSNSTCRTFLGYVSQMSNNF